MRNQVLLDIAQRQLRHASMDLSKEWAVFFFEQVVSELAEERDNSSETVLGKTYGLSNEETKELLDWVIESVIYPDSPDFDWDAASVYQKARQELRSSKAELDEFLSQVIDLGKKITKLLQEQLSDKEIKTLDDIAKAADLLRRFTEHWRVYLAAWEQRHVREPIYDKWDEHVQMNINAGDNIVRSLYSDAVGPDLEKSLQIDHTNLIVVPLGGRLYASGFDMPMPYIVAPRWGYLQPWTWLSYPHEVGHHIYRNIKGLRQELKVNVAMTLASEGYDYAMQRIWYNWLEEIFADLFGLLQIGPVFIELQQSIAFHIAPQVLEDVKKNGFGPQQALLWAADDTHAIPYLRVCLTMRALEMLIELFEQTEEVREFICTKLGILRDRWKGELFQDPDEAKKMVLPLDKGRKMIVSVEEDANRVVFPRLYEQNRTATLRELQYEAVSTEAMESAGEIVLENILKTPLYALADKSGKQTLITAFSKLNKDYVEKYESAKKKLLHEIEIGKASSHTEKVISILRVVNQYNERRQHEPKSKEPYDMGHLLAAAQEFVA